MTRGRPLHNRNRAHRGDASSATHAAATHGACPLFFISVLPPPCLPPGRRETASGPACSALCIWGFKLSRGAGDLEGLCLELSLIWPPPCSPGGSSLLPCSEITFTAYCCVPQPPCDPLLPAVLGDFTQGLQCFSRKTPILWPNQNAHPV